MSSACFNAREAWNLKLDPGSASVLALRLQIRGTRGDNRAMGKPERPNSIPANAPTAFPRGSMTVVTLGSPREKFWGMVLALSVEGLSLSGVELASFEAVTALVKSGEPFTPSVVFFPMHRIERMELDCPDGSLPSLTQRFQARTGMDPAVLRASCLKASTGATIAATDEEPA